MIKDISVVFLDIDGVLLGDDNISMERLERIINNYEDRLSYELSDIEKAQVMSQLFCKVAVDYLNQLLEVKERNINSPYIVISSTWRNLWDNPFGKMADTYVVTRNLKWLWRDHSWSRYIIGVTPDLIRDRHKKRSDEIALWMDSNKDLYNVKSFVIIDDLENATGFKEAFPNNFVKTDSKICFNNQEYEKAVEILKNV